MAVKHSERDSSGFGILSHEVKDNVYMMGRSGFIYTAPWIDTRDTRPPSAAVLLSVGEGRFTVSAGGQEWRGRAILVPPFVPRSLLAANVPLVCFHVMPASPIMMPSMGWPRGGYRCWIGGSSAIWNKSWKRCSGADYRPAKLKRSIKKCCGCPSGTCRYRPGWIPGRDVFVHSWKLSQKFLWLNWPNNWAYPIFGRRG